MKRDKFITRKILFRTGMQKDQAVKLIESLPLDDEHPIEMVVREEVKVRGMDQNALMWAGPLKDISEQAWVHGRRFSEEIWHEHFKREFLPEEYDEELTKDGYVKWATGPKGDRILVGSTKDLTKRGFSQYLTQIEAYAASEHGVQFGARRAA